MKKLITLVTCTLFFISCSDGEVGPPGPQGPPGPPGEPGDGGLIGVVFDVQTNFNADNDFSALFNFAEEGVEVYDSDVVLVYLRVGQDGEAEGEPVYIFRQLPQTYYIDGGTMQYNFDYTFFDVNIFLDTNVDLSTLDPVFTQNQSFRVAVLPAAFAESQNLDVSNYHAVKAALELEKRNIPTFQVFD